jgi:hypothetical protein
LARQRSEPRRIAAFKGLPAWLPTWQAARRDIAFGYIDPSAVADRGSRNSPAEYTMMDHDTLDPSSLLERMPTFSGTSPTLRYVQTDFSGQKNSAR